MKEDSKYSTVDELIQQLEQIKAARGNIELPWRIKTTEAEGHRHDGKQIDCEVLTIDGKAHAVKLPKKDES